MLIGGWITAAAGLAMVVAALLGPSEALPGLLAGGLGCGASGIFLLYLAWPGGNKKKGKKVKARVLGAEPAGEGVANYPLVKLDLEIYPKDGNPYQVSRKFIAGKFSTISPGDEIDVRIPDPTEPEKVELA
jgi:hypothetical protein